MSPNSSYLDALDQRIARAMERARAIRMLVESLAARDEPNHVARMALQTAQDAVEVLKATRWIADAAVADDLWDRPLVCGAVATH